MLWSFSHLQYLWFFPFIIYRLERPQGSFISSNKLPIRNPDQSKPPDAGCQKPFKIWNGRGGKWQGKSWTRQDREQYEDLDPRAMHLENNIDPKEWNHLSKNGQEHSIYERSCTNRQIYGHMALWKSPLDYQQMIFSLAQRDFYGDLSPLRWQREGFRKHDIFFQLDRSLPPVLERKLISSRYGFI